MAVWMPLQRHLLVLPLDIINGALMAIKLQDLVVTPHCAITFNNAGRTGNNTMRWDRPLGVSSGSSPQNS